MSYIHSNGHILGADEDDFSFSWDDKKAGTKVLLAKVLSCRFDLFEAKIRLKTILLTIMVSSDRLFWRKEWRNFKCTRHMQIALYAHSFQELMIIKPSIPQVWQHTPTPTLRKSYVTYTLSQHLQYQFRFIKTSDYGHLQCGLLIKRISTKRREHSYYPPFSTKILDTRHTYHV